MPFLRAFIRLCVVSYGPLVAAQRLASLDVCADQWLLWLLPQEQIAAVTYLAHDPAYSYFHKRAAGVTSHNGRVEALVRLKVDTVIADGFMPPAKQAMLEKVGIKVSVIPPLSNTVSMEDRVRFVENVLKIKSPMESQNNPRPKRAFSKKRGVFFQAPNLAEGPLSPAGIAMEELGIKNIVRRGTSGSVSLEQLLAFKPTQIFYAEGVPPFAVPKGLKSQSPFALIKTQRLQRKYTMCAVPPVIEALRNEIDSKGRPA